ncbi:MAG: hypothetical protein WC762_09220 [Methylobacter sp.]
MKVIKMLKAAMFIVAVLFNATASAYSVGEVEEVCKKPQFREFSLPVYKEPEKVEVAPESEFTFMISPWADPNTVTLTAKGQPLEFTVESNNSFHRVKAKLPAALTGNFVRIDTTVKAVLGCGDEDGWLVKVAGS